MDKKCVCCNRSTCPRQCKNINVNHDKSSSSVQSETVHIREDKETQRPSHASWIGGDNDHPDVQNNLKIPEGSSGLAANQAYAQNGQQLYEFSTNQESNANSSMSYPAQSEYDHFYDCCSSSNVSTNFTSHKHTGNSKFMEDVYKHMKNPERFRKDLSRLVFLTEQLLNSKFVLSSPSAKYQSDSMNVLKQRPVSDSQKINSKIVRNQIRQENISATKRKFNPEDNSQRKSGVLAKKQFDTVNNAPIMANPTPTAMVCFEIPVDIRLTLKKKTRSRKPDSAEKTIDKLDSSMKKFKSKKLRNTSAKKQKLLEFHSCRESMDFFSDNFRSCKSFQKAFPDSNVLASKGITSTGQIEMAIEDHMLNSMQNQDQESFRSCETMITASNILPNDEISLVSLSKNIMKKPCSTLSPTQSEDLFSESFKSCQSSDTIYPIANILAIQSITSSNSGYKKAMHPLPLPDSLPQDQIIQLDSQYDKLSKNYDTSSANVSEKQSQLIDNQALYLHDQSSHLSKNFDENLPQESKQSCIECECVSIKDKNRLQPEDKFTPSDMDVDVYSSTSKTAASSMPFKPPKKIYNILYPQHKDLQVCIRCCFEPSPLIDENGIVFCPGNCGCCLCPWQARATRSQEDLVMHTKLKICICRQRGTIFKDFVNKGSNCSQLSYFDVCPCRERAEVKYMELFATQMWNDDRSARNPSTIGPAVLLSQVQQIEQGRKLNMAKYRKSLLYMEKQEELERKNN